MESFKRQRRDSDDLADIRPEKRPVFDQQYVSQSSFRGQGLQQSGSGTINVGGNLNIGNEFDRTQNANCLADLRVTDPSDDKTRIESMKGGLLADSYSWICEHADFKRWRNDEDSRLLWIKGDPGKGKTMLLCGIVNELEKMRKSSSMDDNENISFFFCRATEEHINNATAVLRGLIWLLVAKQQTELISYVREEYDRAGRELFKGVNTWFTLSSIFTKILKDRSLKRTYLIIDALDECTTDLSQLLEFIVLNSSQDSSPRVKWVISSRNWPTIEKDLSDATDKVRLCLELNQESISEAVEIYIRSKVDELAKRNGYQNDKDTKECIRSYLSSNANGTFLWVSLVCKKLYKISRRNVRKHLTLEEFPPGLDEFYSRMIQNLTDLEDSELCKNVLAVLCIVHRPITLKELETLVDVSGVSDDDELREIIESCGGSFLTLQGNIISFVHQSAKDYLMKEESIKIIFPEGRIENQQETLVLQSITAMSNVLQRDIYNLQELGRSIEDIERISSDPLEAIRYACSYWVDHLCEVKCDDDNDGNGESDILSDGGEVHQFLTEHFLHWLEALSLMKSIAGVAAKLTRLLKKFTSESAISRSEMQIEIKNLVSDARRFIMSNRHILEHNPLQLYSSALIFSPINSAIRALFLEQEIDWITTTPAVEANWGACIQTHYGDVSAAVESIAFSRDSAYIASGDSEGNVKIWDVESGTCVKELTIASGGALWDGKRQVIFVSSGLRIAFNCNSSKTNFEIWDAITSAYYTLQLVLQGEASEGIEAICLLKDGKRVALGLENGLIEIWDCNPKIPASNRIRRLKGHTESVDSMSLSNDGLQLASASQDNTIKIWNTATVKISDTTSGILLQTLLGHTDPIQAVAFSDDGALVASGSNDNTIRIWESDSPALDEISDDHMHTSSVTAIAFSKDGEQIASGSSDMTIKIWSISGAFIQALHGHSSTVRSIAFSQDGGRIVSGSADNAAKIWDISGTGSCIQTLEGHTSSVQSVGFSNDGERIVTGSYDKTVKIWNVSCGACIQTLSVHTDAVSCVAFSNDDELVVSGSDDNTIKICDMSGTCLQTLNGDTGVIRSVAISNDDKLIAAGSFGGVIKVWDLESGKCLKTCEINRQVGGLTFGVTNSHVLCNAGIIPLDINPDEDADATITDFHLRGYGLSKDRDWITWNGKDVLWLPVEYRSEYDDEYIVSEDAIAIGCQSGRVLILTFSSSIFPLQ
ncbi:hypothetical protein TWF191_009319 [Orbilia oligospora]|uniref:NACHT domain-containing protein n=1 Tax=Orbilia oligospora TaxID=2813651 RepID=A0A7C8QK59_ORBOL|nr:hypothetical protein TWF191_009319 [Orbilia oligospora]